MVSATDLICFYLINLLKEKWFSRQITGKQIVSACEEVANDDDDDDDDDNNNDDDDDDDDVHQASTSKGKAVDKKSVVDLSTK